MSLEVGSVFTRLGYREDATEAERYERRVSKLRTEARRPIEQKVDVNAKTDGLDRYERRVRDVDHAHGDLVRGSGRVRGALGSLFIGGAGFAGVTIAAGAAAKGVGYVVGQFQESQRVGRQTNAVLKSTGQEAGVTAKHIGTLATALSQKTGVDDEAIQSGENLLLTFTNVRNEVGKGNDVFDQATKLAVDMSSALGTDLSGANIQLGKALNDPIKGITALQRVGVSFTQQQRDQIKTLVDGGHRLDAQKIILRELTKEFGGSAAATATNSAKMKVAIGNVAETVGGKLNPYVQRAAGFLLNFSKQITSGTGAGGKFASVVRTIADVVRGGLTRAFDFVKGAISTVSSIIRENRARLEDIGRTVLGLWRTVARAFGQIRDAFSSTFGRGSGTGRDIRNIITQILTIVDAIEKVVAAVVRRALPGIINAFRGFAQIIRGVIRLISGILSGDFRKAWEGVKDIFRGATKAVEGIIRAASAPLREVAAAVGRAIGGAFSSAWGAIERTAAGFVNRIIDIINVIPGVDIGHVSWGGSTVPNQHYGSNLGRTGHLAQGGKVTMPIAIMGEEAPQHPEWVIPTNPAYRGRAVGLWMEAARELGIPGFALGGVLGDALHAGKSIVDFASSLPGRAVRSAAGVANWLVDRLPSPPGGIIGGAMSWAKDKAIEFIKSKAGSIFDAITPDFGGGGAGGMGVTGGLAPIVLRALAWARGHGWHGSVTSGYRDPAKQQYLWDHSAELGLIRGVSVAAPGTSMHERGLAVDVTDVPGFQRAMASAPANSRLYWRGSTDPVHFSTTGHRRGGILYRGDHVPMSALGAMGLTWLPGFRKGGKHTPPKPILGSHENRGIKRSVARAGRGIGGFEQGIQDLERTYDQKDRRFGLSDEVFLVEHDDGSVTVDDGAVHARVKELDDLIKQRKKVQAKIKAYRHAITKLLKAIGKAIRQLQRALKQATGKARKKERAGYRAAIGDYQDRAKELRQTFDDLGFDLVDQDIDLQELRGERGEVKGTTGTPAPAEPPDTADAPATDDGSAPDPGDTTTTPPSPEEIAQAAAAQLAAFQAGRASLFSDFGANFAAAGTNPFAGVIGQAAGMRFFGAGGALGGAGGLAGRIEGPLVVNHFAEGPTDPHTWTQQQRFELENI